MLLFISFSSSSASVSLIVSIHLMLLFIIIPVFSSNWKNPVSIHLMLLFISPLLITSKLSDRVSIHLMLLFIMEDAGVKALQWEFQYISCCCLSGIFRLNSVRSWVSIHLMLLFIYCRRCYSVREDMFQYISCCCLSKLRSWFGLKPIGFNTSHVVVYLTQKGRPMVCPFGFNTSHVVVYRGISTFSIAISGVSIHLMLLFIYHVFHHLL